MENLDLNALGVMELDNSNLIDINGGQINTSPWGGVLGTALDICYKFLTEVVPVLVEQLCDRASEDGYVVYADIAHR